MSVIIIAEAGVNHNGSISTAKALIDVAAAAKVDYVKFQTFKAEKLVSASAVQAEYQKKNLKSGKGDSQLSMLKKLELSEKEHEILINYCKKKKVKFFSTAFDLNSLNFLISLNLGLFKVPSGEITNLPYLELIGKQNKPTILSTGMCNMAEIEAAINVLVGAGCNRNNITVLHCNTEYPTPFNDVNLKAMLTIKEAFKVNVGYSDHTLGIEIPIAAVAMGAKVIEKHFTLDKTLPGPDHIASLEPHELKAMVIAIRNIEQALSGNGLKEASNSEKKNIAIARKSIHLAKSVKKGTAVKLSDLIMKRPGNGISPMELKKVIGKAYASDFNQDQLLEWNHLV